MRLKLLLLLSIFELYILASCQSPRVPISNCDTGTLSANFNTFSESGFLITDPLGNQFKKIDANGVFNFSLSTDGKTLFVSRFAENNLGIDWYSANVVTGQWKFLFSPPIQYGQAGKWLPSPSGQLIAISIAKSDNFIHLYILNSSSTKLVDLTGTSDNFETPLDWSIDGRNILFDSFSNTTKIDSLKISHADGSGIKTIYSGEGTYSARWSPDNRQLVLSDGVNQERHISLFDMASSNRIELPSIPVNSWSPAWSPDGGCIAYLHGTGIYIYSLTTKKTIELPIPAFEGGYNSLDWSHE